MTEASPVTHISPVGKFVAGSTGPGVPNTRTKLVDTETGETIDPMAGRRGELCVQGPQVRRVLLMVSVNLTLFRRETPL